MSTTEQDILIAFCKQTITRDNVNRIPADWDHPLLGYAFTLDQCKRNGHGFLPLMIMCTGRYDALSRWFVTTWGRFVNLDAEYPYTMYRARDPTWEHPYPSLIYAISWNGRFAYFLLQAGATPSLRSFQHLVMTRALISSDDEKCMALFHFDRGLVPLDAFYESGWIQEQCSRYRYRRAYCRRALIRFGGLLRRRSRAREAGWDRHLVQHMMRYVWATRWHEEWN